MYRRMSVLVPILALCACVAGVPKAIRQPAPGDITVVQAQGAPDGLVGSQVRWGGTIATVQNRASETWIEIVDRPLDSSGRPQQTDKTGGRFLARVSGFLDPAIYSKGRDVTVAGTLLSPLKRTIGDYPYLFPVVKTQVFHLWPVVVQQSPPQYYDPFWPDPWYPWGYPFPYRTY